MDANLVMLLDSKFLWDTIALGNNIFSHVVSVSTCKVRQFETHKIDIEPCLLLETLRSPHFKVTNVESNCWVPATVVL